MGSPERLASLINFIFCEIRRKSLCSDLPFLQLKQEKEKLYSKKSKLMKKLARVGFRFIKAGALVGAGAGYTSTPQRSDPTRHVLEGAIIGSVCAGEFLLRSPVLAWDAYQGTTALWQSFAEIKDSHIAESSFVRRGMKFVLAGEISNLPKVKEAIQEAADPAIQHANEVDKACDKLDNDMMSYVQGDHFKDRVSRAIRSGKKYSNILSCPSYVQSENGPAVLGLEQMDRAERREIWHKWIRRRTIPGFYIYNDILCFRWDGFSSAPQWIKYCLDHEYQSLWNKVKGFRPWN